MNFNRNGGAAAAVIPACEPMSIKNDTLQVRVLGAAFRHSEGTSFARQRGAHSSGGERSAVPFIGLPAFAPGNRAPCTGCKPAKYVHRADMRTLKGNMESQKWVVVVPVTGSGKALLLPSGFLHRARKIFGPQPAQLALNMPPRPGRHAPSPRPLRVFAWLSGITCDPLSPGWLTRLSSSFNTH